MDPLSIVSYALQALDLVPRVIAAGQDIASYVSKTKTVIQTAHDTQTKIPDSAWDELKVVRESLQKRLHGS